MITLRDYQQKGVDDVRREFMMGKKAPMYVLPTGGGKTIFFTHIAHASSARGRIVWVLVHRIELLRQTSQKLSEFGVRHGLINPNYSPDPTAKVQVASVQTLVRRMQKIPKHLMPDLIIIDEAHHATASSWRQIVAHCGNPLLLGVTATPIRSDGVGLGVNSGGMFDTMVQGPQIRELIDMGFLCEPLVYGAKNPLDFSGVRIKMGDYDKNELGLFMSSKPKIVGDVISHYRELCDRVPAVAFCPTVQHAEQVADSFRQAGYRSYSVDGSMEDDVRNKILKGLGNGSIDVVTSCDLIGEGVDIPAVGCAILLRKTQSKGLHIQQIGRALRVRDGKKHAVILDHVGNSMQHGLPDAYQDWKLDGEQKKKKGKSESLSINVTQCMQCYAVYEPAPKCPVCGHIKPTAGRAEVEQVAGKLELISAKDLETMRKENEAKSKRMEVGKAKTLQELQKIAQQRGYKPSWAEHIFNSRITKQQQR